MALLNQMVVLRNYQKSTKILNIQYVLLVEEIENKLAISKNFVPVWNFSQFGK